MSRQHHCLQDTSVITEGRSDLSKFKQQDYVTGLELQPSNVVGIQNTRVDV